jgi:endophilin-A
MFNIMENDVEQIAQLMQFAEALLEYHKQCSEILQVHCAVFIKSTLFSVHQVYTVQCSSS